MKSPKIVGAVHVRPLVGAARSDKRYPSEILQKAGFEAVQEAKAWAAAGADAVILQNTGDSPYFNTTVPSETVACMAIIAAAVRESISIDLGIQVFNDPKAALAIASVTGCDFIRIALSDDRGDLDQFAKLMRDRVKLNSKINIFIGGYAKKVTQHLADFSKNESPDWLQGVIYSASSGILAQVKKTKVPILIELDDHLSWVNFEKNWNERKLTPGGFVLSPPVRKLGLQLELKPTQEVIRQLKRLESGELDPKKRTFKKKSSKHTNLKTSGAKKKK